MEMRCLVCGMEFTLEGWNICPQCGAVGDDLEPIEDEVEEWEPTEEELEAMYEDYEMRRQIGNACAVIGAQ